MSFYFTGDFIMATRYISLSKFALFTSLFFLLTGCGPAVNTNNSNEINDIPLLEVPQNTNQSTTESYPSPTLPATLVEAYPIPDKFNENAILLAFDKPILVSDTNVSGVGPPGLQVYVSNITLMGEELGSGVIGEDGNFRLEVSHLEPGTRIGLSADISTLGLKEEDVRPGENAISIPRVGYFFDSFVLTQ